DAGSNNHPIRPDEYMEINNFYTPTVYEKGAEVIRMIYNYLGEKLYRKGMDVYFNKFDGKAVTCEDFLKALELGSNLNLDLFKEWYSQAGTPTLNIKRVAHNNKIVFDLYQTVNEQKSYLPIPIAISLIDKKGDLVEFSINNSKNEYEHVYLLSKSNDKIEISCHEDAVVPSLLRGFSAPVNIKTDLTIIEYLHVLKYDNDSFNKWEAIQNLYLSCLENEENISLITSILSEFLNKKIISLSLIAYLLELPSKTVIENLSNVSDPIDVYNVRRNLIKKIGLSLQSVFEKTSSNLMKNDINQTNNTGERLLLGKILNFLVLIQSNI
ncbi:MAG: DUF3458 domain-containing protein, partial [Candidatus Puniceispirillales bacterium]